jgi:hypothetical protein
MLYLPKPKKTLPFICCLEISEILADQGNLGREREIDRVIYSFLKIQVRAFTTLKSINRIQYTGREKDRKLHQGLGNI